jgi:hypothetical protein
LAGTVEASRMQLFTGEIAGASAARSDKYQQLYFPDNVPVEVVPTASSGCAKSACSTCPTCPTQPD